MGKRHQSIRHIFIHIRYDRLYIIQIACKVSYEVFDQPNRLADVYFIADWSVSYMTLCQLLDVIMKS